MRYNTRSDRSKAQRGAMKTLGRFGVYAIVNDVTSEVYIGSTSITFRSRYHDHWTKLRLGIHKNERLQRAWHKYGEQSFSFAILEVADDPARVLELEQVYLDRYWGESCYNARPTAESNRGWSPSEETRGRMSEAGKGKHSKSEEQRKALSDRFRGINRSNWTDEARAKLAAAKQGKQRPDTFRQQMREENQRRLQDPAYRERISRHLQLPEFIERNRERNQRVYPGVFCSPDGVEYRGVVNLKAFCQKHGLTLSSMGAVVRGIFRQHKGWTYFDEQPDPNPRE